MGDRATEASPGSPCRHSRAPVSRSHLKSLLLSEPLLGASGQRLVELVWDGGQCPGEDSTSQGGCTPDNYYHSYLEGLC